MYSYVLFDLDGTLVNTGEGIIESAKYSFQIMGEKIPSDEQLRKFVGPPLKKVYMQDYGMSSIQAQMATKLFRDHYAKDGKYRCEPYEGIKALLQELNTIGIVLFVATSKPTEFAIDILRHFGMREFFREIVGSNMDNTRSSKKEVIDYILKEHDIQDLKQVVMIGDKAQDLIGASECGIDGIGVLYGFGEFEELESNEHVAILKTVCDLRHYFLDRYQIGRNNNDYKKN